MRLAGSEVPIVGCDSLVSTQLTVPHRHHHPPSSSPAPDDAFAPPPRDFSFCYPSLDRLSYLVGTDTVHNLFGIAKMNPFGFVVKPLRPSINMEEGGCIDVTLSFNKLWIVKENGLESYSLFHSKTNLEDEECYILYRKSLLLTSYFRVQNILFTIFSGLLAQF